MGYVSCRACGGTGKKWVTLKPRRGSMFGETKEFVCKACNGSGINYKLRAANCSRCGGEIVYPADAQFPPTYCRSCKDIVRQEKEREKAARDAKWREKSCSGCFATIKYNVDWDKIPDLCPSCKESKRREREAQKAKWKEKSCTGCGATVKYHVDWNKIPDLCSACREKKKKEREAQRANMREKPCPGADKGLGCPHNNIIRWDESKHPGGYSLCKQCSDRKRAEWPIQSDNKHALVKVKGDLGDGRTDILVVDKSINQHKHFTYNDKGDESDWHDWKN